jgi:hypothetical protein
MRKYMSWGRIVESHIVLFKVLVSRKAALTDTVLEDWPECTAVVSAILHWRLLLPSSLCFHLFNSEISLNGGEVTCSVHIEQYNFLRTATKMLVSRR